MRISRTPPALGLLFLVVQASVGLAGEAVGVVVGDVTSTSARLHVEAGGMRPVSVTIAPDGAPTWTRSLQPDAERIARTTLHGLLPGRRHRYRIVSDGHVATGEFVTPPAAGDAAPVRLLWSGDLGARGHCGAQHHGVFEAMATRRPDLFLFVGDTVYADHPCPALPGAAGPATTFEEFRVRYRHNLAVPAVQAFLRRTSVTAIWDDHEVRGNFAGPRQPLMRVGRTAFLASWPVATPAHDPTRLYRSRRWGALLEIFVLDTRQYRSSNWAPDGPDKTMLGAAQRRWLVDAVAASTATWKVVVSTVPLSLPKGWPVGDSWAPRNVLGYRTGFAHERDEILHGLRAAGVQNLVVLAADVHFAAAIAHAPAPGFRVWELVAGPLAAGTKAPWCPAPGLESRVLFAHGGEATFGELQVGAEAIDVRVFAGDARLLWSGRLPAKADRPIPAAQGRCDPDGS